MVLVYVVCRDRDEARRISRALLESRLVACTNLFPVESAYWWQGSLVEDAEVVLIAKTRAELFEAVRQQIKRMHSYEVPAIICLPVVGVDERYLAWLQGETCTSDTRSDFKAQPT